MAQSTETFVDLLDCWPSRAVIARDVDVPYETVVSWARRNSVPARYWRPLVRSAKMNKLAITIDRFQAIADRQSVARSHTQRTTHG